MWSFVTGEGESLRERIPDERETEGEGRRRRQ